MLKPIAGSIVLITLISGCSGCSVPTHATESPQPVLPFALSSWRTVAYPILAVAFRGRSVKPELFPPILAG